MGEVNVDNFFCPNEACPDYGKKGRGNIVLKEHYGKQNTALLKCKTCNYSQVPLRLGLGSFLTLHGARSPIAIEDNLLLPARRSYESSLALLMFEVLELRPNVLGMQVLYFPIEPASPYVLMTNRCNRISLGCE
jgi:hypothetical protein